MYDTLPLLNGLIFLPMRRCHPDALQVNRIYRCNRHSLHCYVNAGPTRQEDMTQGSVEMLREVIYNNPVLVLGLAPSAASQIICRGVPYAASHRVVGASRPCRRFARMACSYRFATVERCCNTTPYLAPNETRGRVHGPIRDQCYACATGQRSICAGALDNQRGVDRKGQS